MEKLRKFGQWLWRNKERMVLVIMLGVLGWRVYMVLYPPEEESPKNFRVPSASEQVDVPTPPDPILPPPLPPTSALVNNNMFDIWRRINPEVTTEDGAERVNIKLLAIKQFPGGVYRAQIQTKAKKWIAEGEEWETFRLLKIDPDLGQVEVYSENLGKSVTLKLPGAK